MKRTAVLFAGALALATTALTPAIAQQGGNASPEMNSPAQGNATQVDTETFIRMAASSNQFEILSSQMALERASDQQVKSFAQMMIDDHTTAGTRMKEVLTAANLGTPLPADGELEDRHQEMLDTLEGNEGQDFQAAYVQMQTQAHQQAVQLFQQYAKSGDNAAVQTFAQETLPRLEQHLTMVQQMPGAPVDATGSTTGTGSSGTMQMDGSQSNGQ